MVAGAKHKLEMIKAERQESGFSDTRPVPVTAKVAWGTRCTHLKEAGTPLPGLLWIFTASSEVLSWIQQLKRHSLSTYYVPVPYNRDANKTGAFNSRAQEQLEKWMTAAIINAVPLCESMNLVWWEHREWVWKEGVRRENAKTSCHEFGPYRKCRSWKAAKKHAIGSRDSMSGRGQW